MSKQIANWIDFVRFIKNDDFWSRWNMVYDPQQEPYLEQQLALVTEGKTGISFDFSKVNNVQVMSKDESQVNWDHDGETLVYFFIKVQQGGRL